MAKPAPEQPETQVLQDPALETRSLRRFSTEFKLRVIARADACQYGELGELHRSERLYSAQLQQWPKELATGGGKGLSKTKPSPRSARSPDQRRIQQLEKDPCQLQRKLEITQDCVDLQRKLCRCWIGQAMAKPNEDGPGTAPRPSSAGYFISVGELESWHSLWPLEAAARPPGHPNFPAVGYPAQSPVTRKASAGAPKRRHRITGKAPPRRLSGYTLWVKPRR
jgi:transposase